MKYLHDSGSKLYFYVLHAGIKKCSKDYEGYYKKVFWCAYKKKAKG